MSDQGDEPDAQAQIDDGHGDIDDDHIDDDHGGIDDGNSSEESLDGRNPSLTNVFFYISRDNNNLFPKDGYTLPELRDMAISAGNIPLLQELFNDPEGPTMTSLLSGLTANTSRGSMLVAAIVDALHRFRSNTMIYFLKNIVNDLAQRPYAVHREIENMFVGNLLTFIVEKPSELQSAITLIQESILIDREKASRGYDLILNQLKKLDGTFETAHSVCQNVNNSLRSCSDIAALFPTIPTVHVVSPDQLNLKGSLSVENYEKIKELKPFPQGVRAAVLDHCRVQVRKVSALGRECISDMKARNADLSKLTTATRYMQDDGTISAKGRRVLSGLSKSNGLAGTAAKADKDGAEEESANAGRQTTENETELDEDDEDVKLYRSWQADRAKRAAEEARAAAEADEDRKLKRLAKFQAKETAKAFTRAFQKGNPSLDQSSDSEAETGPSGRN